MESDKRPYEARGYFSFGDMRVLSDDACLLSLRAVRPRARSARDRMVDDGHGRNGTAPLQGGILDNCAFTTKAPSRREQSTVAFSTSVAPSMTQPGLRKASRTSTARRTTLSAATTPTGSLHAGDVCLNKNGEYSARNAGLSRMKATARATDMVRSA